MTDPIYEVVGTIKVRYVVNPSSSNQNYDYIPVDPDTGEILDLTPENIAKIESFATMRPGQLKVNSNDFSFTVLEASIDEVTPARYGQGRSTAQSYTPQKQQHRQSATNKSAPQVTSMRREAIGTRA